MKHTRLWIVTLAVLSFFSGVASGVLGVHAGAGDFDRGRFAAYGDWIIDEFDLSRERPDRCENATSGAGLGDYADKCSNSESEHQSAALTGASGPGANDIGGNPDGVLQLGGDRRPGRGGAQP